ncbi:MAG: iron ABC transporter substrate-binding protein [Thermomicrobiales bacterium]|nr:iron ABC transporter substrate-binding protein [Thermomicrobiales bacterium]
MSYRVHGAIQDRGAASLTRRSVLTGAVAAAGVVAAGRLPVLAQDGGEITVYSGRNENLIGPILTQFQEATGITVNARYGSTSEIAATILEEGANSPADVFLSQDAGALGAVQAEGLFTQLPEATLALVDPRYNSADGLWVGLTARARVLAYNTEELTEADLPASVNDLTDASWNGRIGWAPTNASFQSFITAYRVLEGEDAAKAWLEAMSANGTVTFDGNGAILQAVADGELSGGLINHYYLYGAVAEAGGPIGAANYYFPGGDIGSLVNVTGIGILQTAPNAGNAQALIDYLLGEEGQTYFALETSEYPVVAGIETVEGLPALEEIETPEIDLSDLADLQGTLELLAEVGLV